MSVPQIIILCSGIGHVRRGMERSVADMHEQLAGSLGAQWHLLSGGGPEQMGSRAMPMISRHQVPRLATLIRPTADLEVEQLTFFAGCMPLLVRLSPDIIYTRNKFLSKLLAAWKTILRRKTRIIYGNGATSRPPFPKSFDIIQHLTAYRCRAAIAAQEPPDRQRFVPNAFHLRPVFSPTTTEEKRAQRRQLGLPADKRIVLCVSALNRYHKRIDHLIREVARLDDRDVVLVLLGQHERETPDLLALGREELGARFIAASVPASAVDGYYRAADAFVLPSCWEAFGRVIVESLAHGLPTLVHSGESFREIAGPHGTFVDMAHPGLLADALASPAVWLREPGARVAAHRWAYEHYSWDRLKGPYLEMFESCLRLP